MAPKPLTESEREFLSLVAHAAFANPFGDERTHADLKISGLPASAPRAKRLEAAVAKVEAFVCDLERSGRADPGVHGHADRRLLRVAHLFSAFHAAMDDFDALIQEQMAAGDTPCPVHFAAASVRQLVARGFPKASATWFFGLFYQLRRAYYFIDCSLVGRSPSMRRLRRALWNNVFTYDMLLYEQHLWNRLEDFSTLLLGETGTGKGTAATAIGRSGFIPYDEKKGCFTESFMRSFVAINLSQFPETLIESELFGHKKGAFTGAIEDHEGIFARCSPHGAIFLDEIGDVSIPVQIKLLQVLQERAFSPVGSHRRQRFHGRVIAASNRPIQDLRRESLFRDDFFYRLCSDIITVPTLRQRIQEAPEELRDLLALTVSRIVGEPSEPLTALVLSAIEEAPGRNYPWPGNVRELEQCVRRILLTHRYDGDTRAVSPDLRSTLTERIDAGAYTAQDLLTDYCTLLYKRLGTYEDVARRTGLDRRTVKKYITRQ